MLKISNRQREQGDTLIEVILAFAILSAVAVGAIVIMNQGVSSAQNSLEITLVRNQIDTQAELLRHLNNGKLTSVGRTSNDAAIQWDAAVRDAKTSEVGAQKYDEIVTMEHCKADNRDTLPSTAFFIDPSNGTVVRDETRFLDSETFAQVQPLGTNMISNMLWIEAVASPDDPRLELTQYYDFHIRACWEAPGAGAGLMKLGTIVRLYVPIE